MKTFDNTKQVAKRKSLLELAQDGISQADIDGVLKESWEIYPIIHQILGITRYYTKSWQGSYLYTNIKDGLLTIAEDNNTAYQVIYQGCTALSVKEAAQVRISFRASLYGNFALVQLTNRPPYTYSAVASSTKFTKETT